MVQVMTIHKAKGLTFDITIVPDLESKRLDQARKESLHTRRSENGEVEWIMDLPGKDLCQADEPLAAAVADARSEGCYESFCKLYVALTRPSHGLYVITSKPSGESRNFPRLLTDTLAEGEAKPFEDGTAQVVFEEGNFDWVKAKEVESPKLIPVPELNSASRSHARLAKRRASGHGPVVLSGAQLFALREPDAISFGLAVHKVFEQIEWAGKEALAKLESLREKMPAEAVDEVEQCLVDEALAKRLAKPNSDVELWRERPFDVVLGDELISGVFDRVHLFADRAEIIDFKTEKAGEEAADRHRPQLQLYRSALAKLTGLEESAISSQLLFTHTHSLLDVD